MDPERRPPTVAAADWVLFFVPSFIWGTTWLVIKFQLGSVAPEASVAYRFGLASLLLFAWCALQGLGLRFDLRAHAGFALMGLLQFALNYVLIYQSERYLTSGLVALLFGLVLIWNLAGARIFFRSPLSPPIVAGAVLGMVGITLVLSPDLARLHGTPEVARGVVFVVLATLSASLANLWSQRMYRRGVAVLPSTAWAMLYGALAVAAYAALRGVAFGFDPSLRYVASLAYLAIFGSVFAFGAYLTLLRRIGAGRAGYTSVVIPALAIATSTVFEGYRWTAPALAGLVLVIAGNVLMLRRPKPAPPSRPEPS